MVQGVVTVSQRKGRGYRHSIPNTHLARKKGQSRTTKKQRLGSYCFDTPDACVETISLVTLDAFTK